jgi:hypothetical protein
MPKCASCRNKSSSEQCPNNCLPGLSVCGVHARTKRPRLWIDEHGVREKGTLVWRLWRGYLVRKQLKMAGPGVLKRSLCHNEEEIVSMDSIKSIHPLEYFGFEEGGKVYGFDVRTMLEGMIRNRTPTNPYTRQPLSMEARKRLRWIHEYRVRQKMPYLYENNQIVGYDAVVTSRFNIICQILEENGFADMNPNRFLALNRPQLYVFLKFIHTDIIGWANEHAGKNSVRFKYVRWADYTVKKIIITQTIQECMILTTNFLKTMLQDSVNPYYLCFFIMSALYRL